MEVEEELEGVGGRVRAVKKGVDKALPVGPEVLVDGEAAVRVAPWVAALRVPVDVEDDVVEGEVVGGVVGEDVGGEEGLVEFLWCNKKEGSGEGERRKGGEKGDESERSSG